MNIKGLDEHITAGQPESPDPTPYGTWGDAVDPEYEVCELSDDYGPSHEPLTYQVLVDDIPWTDADGNDTWDTKQEATAIAGHCARQGYTSVEIERT